MLRIGFLGIAHMHGYSYIRQIQSFSGMSVTGIFDHDSLRARKTSDLFSIEAFKDPPDQPHCPVILTFFARLK